jgi:c-di-GMP-binding flagellar brake protein YcgR
MNSPDTQPATSPPTEPDRRRHPRYTLQVQIEIYEQGNEVPMRLQTTDLSRGGCYIEMIMPLAIDVRVRATLWLDGHPILIHGRVVTRHPQFGNGIKFVHFEGQAEPLLIRYLEAVTTT